VIYNCTGFKPTPSGEGHHKIWNSWKLQTKAVKRTKPALFPVKWLPPGSTGPKNAMSLQPKTLMRVSNEIKGASRGLKIANQRY